MYQGLGQMLTKCLQHHQGCPETPKSADVICERPLTAVTKYTKETAYLHITYDKKIRYISIFDVMNTFNVTQDKSSYKSWCQGFISSPLFSRAVAAMCAPLHHFQPVQV